MISRNPLKLGQIEDRVKFARFGSQMTGLGSIDASSPNSVTPNLGAIFNNNLSHSIETYQTGNSIKVLESGYYEITAGYTTNYYSQVEYFIDIFVPTQGGIYNSNRVSNGSSKFTGGISSSTGIVYLEAENTVRMMVDIRGRDNVTASIFLTIKKIK